MKHARILAAVAAMFVATPALAQWQVPDHAVPIGRGAGTGFKSVGPCLAGIPIVGAGVSADPTCNSSLTINSITPTGGTLSVIGAIDNVGTLTTRRTTGNAGGTLNIGGGTFAWQLIGNQLSGGDLLLKNPGGGNVLVFPETGGCMAIQASLTSCTYMLDVGSGSGNAWQRINGATFTNNQGPMLAFSGAGTVLGRIGSDCVFYGATACNNDLYVDGPGTSRHIGFYNWGGVFVTNTPTPAPTHYIGGALTVTTDSTNAFVGGNAITAQSNINTGGNFPTAITALANVVNTTPGGPGATVWGIYSHCDLHETNGLAECASVEGTASNRYGAPGAMPASTVPNPTQPFPVALKGTCGAQISPVAPGLFNCAAGLWLHWYDGNGGWPFNEGIWLTEGVAVNHGIYVGATSTLGATTGVEVRSRGIGGHKGLVIRNMGASSGNAALEFQDSAGSAIGSIAFNGSVSFTNGGSINALSNFSLADNGFQQIIRSVSAPALSANRTLTLDMSNADRTIDLAGNLTIGGALTTAAAFTTSGANALTLTTTGSTNVTLPTSGTLVAIGGTNTWTATNNFNVSSTWGQGTATSTVLNIINGSGATSGGSGVSIQNAGSTIIAMANKSTIVGGAYDNTPIIFGGISPIVIGFSATNAFEFHSTFVYRSNPTTVGALPTCNAGMRGGHGFVTDSNAASYTAGIGAIVAAGGSTNVPVVCDGTNWRIG